MFSVVIIKSSKNWKKKDNQETRTWFNRSHRKHEFQKLLEPGSSKPPWNIVQENSAGKFKVKGLTTGIMPNLSIPG